MKEHCEHIPNISLYAIAKLIGSSRDTEKQIGLCRYKCTRCDSDLRFMPKGDSILSKVHLLSIPIALLWGPCFILLASNLAYSGRINEKVLFVAIFITGVLLAFATTFFSRLLVAILIKHGYFGKFVVVNKNELAKLCFYEELICSPMRLESRRKELKLAGLVLIPLVVLLIAMLILIE